MPQQRLFLLDAYALIFRAYYALIRMPRLTAGGFNTSAVFGFVNTLEELLRRERPTHMAVCFDPPGPTFRHEASAAYKAEREATPEDIRLSVPVIKGILDAYRIPVVEVEGFEADDVIGTMAVKAAAEGFTTYMMTPDKDYGQLVGPSTFQYKPSFRGQDFEVRGEEEICQRYGISRPSQVIDLLALMGDKSDNIPGCPGVGEKTAVKLIADYGSVEALLADTASLKGALRQKVEANAEQIRFSKFLATIRTDVPVSFDAEALRVRRPDADRLQAIFKELEFSSLATRVSRRIAGMDEAKPAAAVQPSLFDTADAADDAGDVAVVQPAVAADYLTAGTEEEFGRLSAELTGLAECGVCILTGGASGFGAPYCGAAVATSAGKAWFIPAESAPGRALLLDLLARPDIIKVTAEAKRDMLVAASLRSDTAEPLAAYYDVTIAHYLLQPDMRHQLPEMASRLLGMEIPPLPQHGGRKRGQADDDAAAMTAAHACASADAALRLMPLLDASIREQGLDGILRDIELPLTAVLAGMERTGVRIDVGALNAAAEGMQQKIDALEEEIHSLAGVPFNVSSPAKVGEILFGRLALDPKAKKTRTGQYSTSEEILEKLAPKHPIVGKIIEYRQLRKLLSTYLTALPAAIDPATGRIHTSYNQTVAATGRLSSSNPNLQNIPVRDGAGREIRRAFIPSEGNLFLSADYSQIELRLVADFAGDDTMLKAFAEGDDIHAITAARIFHKLPEEVSADERRTAKTANFGILYGISAFGLANRLGIPRVEAKELIDSYYATFPAIRKYMDDTIAHARDNGYVATPAGRRRLLPDISSRNPVVRGYAERNAVNAPIQGAAADIIKIAMVSISREMRSRGLRSRMIMQVHDELNFDVVPDELPLMQELVTRLMQEAYSGKVTLTASCGVASNWLDAH